GKKRVHRAGRSHTDQEFRPHADPACHEPVQPDRLQAARQPCTDANSLPGRKHVLSQTTARTNATSPGSYEANSPSPSRGYAWLLASKASSNYTRPKPLAFGRMLALKAQENGAGGRS